MATATKGAAGAGWGTPQHRLFECARVKRKACLALPPAAPIQKMADFRRSQIPWPAPTPAP